MPLTVKIINPDAVLFEGEAEYLMVPSPHGMLGIMPFHTPMFALISQGVLYLKQQAKEEVFPVVSGVVRVKNDVVMVLISK